MIQQKGFSLVELSIVLVILGLLTGGILGGQALMRAAELRSVTTQYEEWQTAVRTFQDKYFAIPGDMANATQFWGDDTAFCDDGNATNNGVTCNGNGDGILNGSGAPGQPREAYMFWQHLALAGMITGDYTGLSGPADVNNSIIGVNSPPSKLGSVGWNVLYADYTGGGSGIDYELNYRNHYRFGTAPNSVNTTSYAAITPAEAWGIDTKMDDGKPARGKVIARFWNNACARADDGTSTDDDFNASYNLADDSIQCALFFIDAF